MERLFGKLLPVVAVSGFACVATIFFAYSAQVHPQASSVLPVCLATNLTALLGAAVIHVFRGQELRIQELERRLRERNDQSASS